ncbi:MAG: transposase [Firmicutes bacterium]|nr:transposase [Bacillota bacterium]
MSQYTSQFKLKVAKDAVEAKTYSEVAKKYGLNVKQIKQWSDAYSQYGDFAFEENGPERYQQQRIRDLEKQLAELQEENEILKKATAFFSKRNL